MARHAGLHHLPQHDLSLSHLTGCRSVLRGHGELTGLPMQSCPELAHARRHVMRFLPGLACMHRGHAQCHGGNARRGVQVARAHRLLDLGQPCRCTRMVASVSRLTTGGNCTARGGRTHVRQHSAHSVEPVKPRYAGRLHRAAAFKRDVRIIDFVDTGHPALLRMWERRQRGYRAMGYVIDAMQPQGM